MKIVYVLLMLISSSTLIAQSVSLNLNHEFSGNGFAYNTNYTTETGEAVSFTRVQYYLSGFSFTHDGGQVTTPVDSYVLASGNITNYSFDTLNASTIEEFSFNIGVDNASNHGNLTMWPSSHPLSAQLPAMDWGWPSGYFFFVINGKVDNTGDGIPNKTFELNGIGDALLRNESFSGLSISGTTIDMYINVADWIKGVNLATAGSQHNGGSINTEIANNLLPETVFSLSPAVGIESLMLEENQLFVDYTMPYAPSIFYDINTKEKLSATVHDLNGKLVFKKDNINAEGNLAIMKELKNGMYIATFSNSQVKETIKFNVVN
jgi:hypothetical protein